MDAKQAADYLRKTAEAIEKMDRFQACALIIPPDNPHAGNVEPLEIMISGKAPLNFGQYVVDQIMIAAAPKSGQFR